MLQTYEGGLGGEPGNEAHGGYAYCGVAAGALAGCLGCLDLPALQAWAASMQVRSPACECVCGVSGLLAQWRGAARVRAQLLCCKKWCSLMHAFGYADLDGALI